MFLPANVAFKQAVSKPGKGSHPGKGSPHGKGKKATKQSPVDLTFTGLELEPGQSINYKVNVKLAKCTMPANITFNAQVSTTTPSCSVNADPVVVSRRCARVRSFLRGQATHPPLSEPSLTNVAVPAKPPQVTVRNHDRSSLKPCPDVVAHEVPPTSHIVHEIAPGPDTPIAAAATKSIQYSGTGAIRYNAQVRMSWPSHIYLFGPSFTTVASAPPPHRTHYIHV